jgi:dihydrofolate reductase
MRNVIFGGANSLDNYLARPNHAVDWLKWSDEVTEFMAEFWPRIDTVIMGRKTYEVAAAAGRAGGYPGVANYVFSRTMRESPSDGVILVGDKAEDFVRQLKEQPARISV